LREGLAVDEAGVGIKVEGRKEGRKEGGKEGRENSAGKGGFERY
jgi:hypothetical protein